MKRIMMLMVVGILTLSGCSAANPDENSNPDKFSNEKIDVYTRDTSSGTRDGFMNGIGFGDAATDDSLLVDGFITNNKRVAQEYRLTKSATRSSTRIESN